MVAAVPYVTAGLEAVITGETLAHAISELMVAGAHYFTVEGPLPTTRETESAPSPHVREMIAESAQTERVGSR